MTAPADIINTCKSLCSDEWRDLRDLLGCAKLMRTCSHLAACGRHSRILYSLLGIVWVAGLPVSRTRSPLDTNVW